MPSRNMYTADEPASGQVTAALKLQPSTQMDYSVVFSIHSPFLQESPELAVLGISNAVNFCWSQSSAYELI